MFSSCSFAVCAMLTVAAAAGPAVNPKLALADSKKIPARRLYEESERATVDRANYYNSVLEQCWTEVTDENYRLIINVEGNRKDELAVALKGANVIAVKTAYETFHDAFRGKEVVNKITFTETRQVPSNIIAAAATATLTSDGFLVVDLPLDAKAADQTPYDRDVPVVESGKPLGSKRPARPPAKLTLDDAYEIVWYMLSSLMKGLALYLNIETKIEATDDSFRFITKFGNATDVTKDDVVVFTSAGFVFISSLIGLLVDSYRLPLNSDVDAITAALTSDGYLVVKVPIVEGAAKPALDVKDVPVEEVGLTLEEMADNLETENDLPLEETTNRLETENDDDKKAADQSSYDRDVPVVESGKPLGSKRTAPPPTKLTLDEAYEIVWFMLSSLMKGTAIHQNIETKIETTDDSFRFITKFRNATDVTKEDVVVYTTAGFVFISSLIGHLVDSYSLPRNSDVDAITAALTSDGYLVVKVPIVEGAAKPALDVKYVPVEEVGLTLEEMADNLETENDLPLEETTNRLETENDDDKEVVQDDDADKTQED